MGKVGKVREVRVLPAVFVVCALVAGCGDSRHAEPQVSAIDRYGIGWVLEDDGRYALRTSLAIEVPAAAVWDLVRDVNDYGSWSKSLTAHVEALEADAPIDLSIQLLAPPLPMTDSRETVGVVDDEVYAVSWGRQFPFDQHSERWQLVVPEGRDTCRYYTALVFTQGLGSLMDATGIGRLTLAAFETFEDELAAEAAREGG